MEAPWLARPVLPVTLTVIAKNEVPVIGRCLDSVPFAADKVVVDSGSVDGTPDIATAHGARVVHQEWLGFGPQRNFATGVAKHDWILVLDADNRSAPKPKRAAPPAPSTAFSRRLSGQAASRRASSTISSWKRLVERTTAEMRLKSKVFATP